MSNETQNILDAIRRIVRALRISSRAAEKDLGVSGAQLFVLQKLTDGARRSLSELAAMTLTHTSSVSVVVSKLLERGLITRTPSESDARRLEIALSKAGHNFLKTTSSTPQERLIQAIDSMGKANRRQLATLLSELIERADLTTEMPSLFFEDEESQP